MGLEEIKGKSTGVCSACCATDRVGHSVEAWQDEDIAVVWIVGIGIGLLLLFSYPKQIGALILLVVLGAVGLFMAIQNAEQRRAEEHRKKVASIGLTATFDPVRCAAEFPILIGFRNGYTQTIQSLNFDLAGYREGFSSPVYVGRYLRSDRIIRPGETYEICWSVPSLEYGAQAEPPQDLNWRVTYSYAAFGEGP